MQEKPIEEKLRDEIKKIGGAAYKLESHGCNGLPDRLVCLPGGRVIFVETKRPKGGRLSALQKYRHKALRLMGFDVRVINTTAAVAEFIEEVRNGK